MTSPPRYLFRVWTDQSNGTNTTTKFKSAWRTWYDVGILASIPAAEHFLTLKQRYTGALMCKNIKSNPFVFTTCSLLYALQHAISKTRGSSETNAHLICIDTRTCRRPDGGTVRFYSALATMAQYGMSTPRARWTYEKRDYSDVWVTTDVIVPGSGSYYVSFEELKAEGLYEMFPELATIARRNNPGLESPVNDMRRLWYSQNRDLPSNELNLAARLAATFKPVGKKDDGGKVPNHLLSWFIALKGQAPSGRRLSRWLNRHYTSTSSAMPPASLLNSSIPELKRFRQIYAVVHGHKVLIMDVEAEKIHVSRTRLRLQVDNYKINKKKWMASTV